MPGRQLTDRHMADALVSKLCSAQTSPQEIHRSKQTCQHGDSMLIKPKVVLTQSVQSTPYTPEQTDQIAARDSMVKGLAEKERQPPCEKGSLVGATTTWDLDQRLLQGFCQSLLHSEVEAKHTLHSGKQQDPVAGAPKGMHTACNSSYVHQLQALVGRLVAEVAGLEDERDELHHVIEILEAEKRDMAMASGALKDKVSYLAASLVQANWQVDALSRHILQQDQPADVVKGQPGPGNDATHLAKTCRGSGIIMGGQWSSFVGRHSSGSNSQVKGFTAGEVQEASVADQGENSLRSGVSTPLTPGRCCEPRCQRPGHHAGPPVASCNKNKAGRAPKAASGRTTDAMAGGMGNSLAWQSRSKVQVLDISVDGACTELKTAAALLGAIQLNDSRSGQQVPTMTHPAAPAKILPKAGLKFAHPVSPQLSAIGCKLAGQHVADPGAGSFCTGLVTGKKK